MKLYTQLSEEELKKLSPEEIRKSLVNDPEVFKRFAIITADNQGMDVEKNAPSFGYSEDEAKEIIAEYKEWKRIKILKEEIYSLFAQLEKDIFLKSE